VITVVLAEAHRLVLEGVRCLLETERDIRVGGETSDGPAVAGLVQRRKPRVLVVALAMPGRNGIELIREVRRATPETAVIVLTMYGDERYVMEALRTGASAYVLKQARGVELAQAIRKVVAGRHYLSPPLSERPIQEWLRRANAGGLQDYSALTAREREVLQLVVHGHTTASIAKHLSISPRTAEAHRARVMRKLGLHTYADLFGYALAHGILALPGDPRATASRSPGRTTTAGSRYQSRMAGKSVPPS